MTEQKTNRTEEQLEQELRKSKGGKLSGKILSMLGVVIAVAGIILGGNLVLVVIGGVILGLGQMVQGKSKEQSDRQAFDAIAPDIVGTVFENVQMNPDPPLLDANDTNIPLPNHTCCSGSGYIRGTYRGLNTELCTVRLTEVSEFQREETGMWEKNEQVVYTGQWMLSELNREFPTWLTIWPRDKMDKLFRSKTIQTGNEDFDKRFNLSSDDEEVVLRILSPDRMERILALAGSSIGKELCRNLKPSSNLAEIEAAQKQTSDALSRIYQRGSISFSGVQDVRGSLKRLEIGSTLGITELLQICALLDNTSRVKSYGRREKENEQRDSLDDLFDALEPLPLLNTEIRRCILSEDEIADDASATLKQIRRSMKVTGERIHTQLAGMVNGSARTYLQDAVITMRNGRYCIPVKAEYKSQVPGMIHDQSSTGSTLFIEPMAIVKLNNEIRDLEMKEAAEIEVILASLSNMAAQERENLRYNLENLVELDFIFARAALAMDMNATRPIFNTKGYINIRKGRHPLIDKKKVVPIDIHLGKEFHLLIVTGPNTGGKTVSLKTVGLLTLMGQAGLHIPALDRSELSVFEEVYADIGDEQSIEQSLSTFSSHMTNVVSFIEKADPKSLVLFDELGAGTDPTEGAALAISILNYLQKQGIRAMATTHYSELKVYALSTPGVENASCEFDVETLRPTYRLLIGVPGKSNAFAISSKLGLPSYIIDDAKKQISQEDESFEDVISTLEENRITIEKERMEIARYKTEVEDLKKQLETKQEKLNQQRDRILREANEQAHAILRDAKEYADQTIKDFNKFGKANISIKEMENKRQDLRKKMNKVESNMSRKEKKVTGNLKPSDLHLGDGVKVLSLNLKGTVSTLPDAKGYLLVQMGIMRSKIHISDLVLLQEETVISAPNMQRTSAGKIKMSKSSSVGIEINLLGRTVDEAIAELDKYLDDAYLAHIPSVRVVHGKGTGALRKGIHNYLRRVKYVSSFHLAEFGEGDAGVTIVNFKK